MQQQAKKPVLPVLFVLVCYVVIAFLQIRIDPLRKQYEPDAEKQGAAARQLPIEFALGALTGFREAIAGLLWVRTDDFFHSGDFKSITPMVRIITWLDPHNIDVYQTGAWHMDYNFTDSQERSDRRYIPLSVALLREGYANNPRDPELLSDLAFTHFYRKIGDYNSAVSTFQEGQDVIIKAEKDADDHPKDALKQVIASGLRDQTVSMGHGYAHALEATGQIDAALKQWQFCIDQHNQNLGTSVDTGGQGTELWSKRIAVKQFNEMTLRRKARANLAKGPLLDVQFDAQLKRIAPKVFILSGHLHMMGTQNFVLEKGNPVWVPVDGARVEVRLQDQGYKMRELPSMDLTSLNLDGNTSIMQDSISVRGDVFSKKIDMSQDPDMYSFSKPKYEVIVWFNPCNPLDAAPNIQDRTGWLGEGITDKRYLDTSGVIPGDTTGTIPGLRQVKKTFILTRDDIMGSTEKVFN